MLELKGEDMIEEKYQIVADFSVSAVEGIKRTGMKVLALRDRYAKIMMPLEGNINHIGTMYAGSLFILGEFSGGILHGVSFDYNKFFPIVREVTIRFQRAAKTDITLEVALSKETAAQIQETAEREGKCDFGLKLDLKDADDQTVAEVEGIWQLRKFRAGQSIAGT